MYIGKHTSQGPEDPRASARPVHLPENYAGNTFREVEESASLTEEEENSSEGYFLPAVAKQEEKTGTNRLLPRFDKLFSSDTLLILLAFLLSSGEDGGELSLLLLLLLLF